MAVTNYDTADGALIGEVKGGVTVTYLADELGSVARTEQGGTIRNRYSYSPYGRVSHPANPSLDPAFLWLGGYGYRVTTRSGAEYYVRNRHYSSTAGNWTTNDQLWPMVDPYAYCLANPILNRDPSGLLPFAIEFNGFVPRRLGLWNKQPMSSTWEYMGDNRSFNMPGTKRVGARVQSDTCAVGGAASIVTHTGYSHRRRVGTAGPIYGRPATVLQNDVKSWGTSRPGGPCVTSFDVKLSSAYPWLPPIAPTRFWLRGSFTVAGPGVVLIEVHMEYALFPDWELLLKVNNMSFLEFGYATLWPNWILATGFMNDDDASCSVTGPTQQCCTQNPCCMNLCVS